MTDRNPVFNWQLIIGFILVAAGALFLVDLFLEIDIMRNYWPLLIVLLGLTFFVGMIPAKSGGAWLAIPGAVITTAGIIFYIHNTFNLWVTWTYAWALLISAVGVGMLIMNISLKRRGLRTAAGWVIGVGLVLFVLFGIFFEIIMDLAGLSINSGVFLGSGLVLLGLFVVLSRFIFSTEPAKSKIEKKPAISEDKPPMETKTEPAATVSEEPQEAEEPIKETILPLEEGVEFTQLVFDVAGDVFIEQGDICKLRIEGEKELVQKIKTEVTEDTLSIVFQSDAMGLKSLKWIGRESKVQYFITVKSLTGLTLSGVGNIQSEKISGETLSLLHSGEGRIILKNINYQALQVSLEGLGEILLEGEAQTQDLDLSGLGTYKAQDLKTWEANVTVSGAGTAKLWVEETLNASLTGAGSILYKGQPAVEKSTKGLGKIGPLDAG